MSESPPSSRRPYLPIAVGFYLLAAPLAVATLFGGAGAPANAAAAALLVVLGAILSRRTAG